MRNLILSVAVTCLAGPALAETQLERMERLTTGMQEALYAHLSTEVPEIAGRLPDAGWDAGVRQAASCSLEAYEDKIGRRGVDQMLDTMEERLSTPISDLATWLDGLSFDAGLSTSETQAIEVGCGFLSATEAKMTADPLFPNLIRAITEAMSR
ncbi:MAG: hypothetical protein AAF330_00485 [Pseudomonadota bacterium]